MKSLAELQALRDKVKSNMGIRADDSGNTRVVVGMATCGIAAGARPVLAAFTDEVARRLQCDNRADRLHRHLPVRAGRRSVRAWQGKGYIR